MAKITFQVAVIPIKHLFLFPSLRHLFKMFIKAKVSKWDGVFFYIKSCKISISGTLH